MSNSFEKGRNIRGQSLTNSPSEPYAWEKPPRFTNKDEAMEYFIGEVLEDKTLIRAKINLLFPANTTNGFDFNTAKYDLELQSDEDHYSQGGKFVIRLLYGTVTIQRRYSKSNQALECNT